MKKVFAFAAIAALVFTSCNEIDAPAVDQMQNEINVVSVNKATKGYVEGSTFVDSPYDKLHGQTPDGKTDRAMMLSAFLTPQSGASANYFVGEEFSKNANGETDNLWHHNPKIYWPMGGTLDFLAYSSTIPFSGTAVKWDEDNASNKAVLKVSEEYLQDDIIYGAVAARNSSNGAPVAMNFNHTQAWIQFQISVDAADMQNIVKVKDITIKNLYTRGELTLNGGATPSHSWNFRQETAIDREMDDTYGILASATGAPYINTVANPTGGTATWSYMDMLVPEQNQTSFVLHYTLEGQNTVLEYTYDLANATWQAGNKYIYQIVFKPYEITVNPSVTPFTVVDPGQAGFPSTLE